HVHHSGLSDCTSVNFLIYVQQLDFIFFFARCPFPQIWVLFSCPEFPMLAAPVTCSTVFDVERSKSLEVGKPLELECEVADSAVPVCWYKDGVKLFPQNGWDMQSKGTMRRLIIPSAELLHSGSFVAIVTLTGCCGDAVT
uniref:Ig-like domain-containing protein n=1 Tax=Sphaeramia orbicularis TaxID=375764 RepID=A0A673B686_9TELE